MAMARGTPSMNRPHSRFREPEAGIPAGPGPGRAPRDVVTRTAGFADAPGPKQKRTRHA